jgi:hypothetical protein
VRRGLEQLLKATIETAVGGRAAKPAEFGRVIVDAHGVGKGRRPPVGHPAVGDRTTQGGQRRATCRRRAQADLPKEGNALLR